MLAVIYWETIRFVKKLCNKIKILKMAPHGGTESPAGLTGLCLASVDLNFCAYIKSSLQSIVEKHLT